MVNFRDPAVRAQDVRECCFAAQARELKKLIDSFDSGSVVFLARPGWSLLVSLPGCVVSPPTMYPNNNRSDLRL